MEKNVLVRVQIQCEVRNVEQKNTIMQVWRATCRMKAQTLNTERKKKYLHTHLCLQKINNSVHMPPFFFFFCIELLTVDIFTNVLYRN